MHLHRALNAARKEKGQLLILVALVLPLLLLFAGFAIDFGFGFLTRAELAKAADAASLAVVLNLGQGQTQAEAIGQSEFNLNYNASSPLNAQAPSVQFTPVTVNGESGIDVTATATIKTFFIRLAGFRTLTVSNFSQAVRPPVILSLVLDKSGSMKLNGGAAALPGSVTDFLGYFIQGSDQLGEVSFSSIPTVDVAINTNFQTPITNSVNGMAFGGGTFATGGLQDGYNEVTGVASPPANSVEVVVFFTDGWANAIQSTVGGNPEDFGGCAPEEFEPPLQWCNGVSCWNGNTGVGSGTVVNSINQGVTCDGVNSFTPTDTAELGAGPVSLSINNIADEADYRTVQLANTMRAAGITVYSIGLGNVINQTYLQEVANDPASPVYNANEPSGLAVFAPTSSDLDSAFQTVASKILLRLTQ